MSHGVLLRPPLVDGFPFVVPLSVGAQGPFAPPTLSNFDLSFASSCLSSSSSVNSRERIDLAASTLGTGGPALSFVGIEVWAALGSCVPWAGARPDVTLTLTGSSEDEPFPPASSTLIAFRTGAIPSLGAPFRGGSSVLGVACGASFCDARLGSLTGLSCFS